MKLLSSLAIALFTLVCSVFTDVTLAMTRRPSFHHPRFRTTPPGVSAIATHPIQNGTFDQLIDHKNPPLGTFSQFYYYSTEFWKRPGSPVVGLHHPGETYIYGSDVYATTAETTGVIAKEIGAAVIIIEHRYWGISSPFQNLTTENLQYQTLKNAIADLNHFALTAKLPFDTAGTSNADKAPWVLAGTSYVGALTAWTEATTKPSVMWAYYASSAVVQTIGNYWSYFLTATENMPQNCSKDVSLVIDYLDNIGETGTFKEQTAIKEKFGFGGLAHYDDFMEALSYGPSFWQDISLSGGNDFYRFCDYIEGVSNNSNKIPGASGVGLEKALTGYANWSKTELIPGDCEYTGYPDFNGTYNVQCFDSYNKSSPTYTDTGVYNAYGQRQWEWFLCGGFGWWQNGAPRGQRSIVSRMIQNSYWTRQCAERFPTENGYTYGLNSGATYNTANDYTGGWLGFTNSTRLIFVSGTNDPWRTSQVVSPLRPGGPQPSTPAQPVLEVPGGFHADDFHTVNGDVNPGCAAVQRQIVQQIKKWVGEYPGYKYGYE